MNLAPGTTHEITRTVTADQTADALGNPGVMVFATPWRRPGTSGLVNDLAKFLGRAMKKAEG